MKKNTSSNADANINWAQYYVLAGHWKDDFEFYCEDLHFLHHLVNNYLLWITKPENLKRARVIEKGLFSLKKECEKLLAAISAHQSGLGTLVDNALSGGDALAITTHARLEKELASFVKRFRENRRQVYKISEYILDSESLPVITR